MARSFFNTTKLTDLLAGSLNFSTRITATPTDFGLTAAQATAYAVLHTTFSDAFVTADEPATRTKVTIQARNDSVGPLRQNASDLAKIISATPTVTNDQKLALGLSVRKTPEPVGPPGMPSNLKLALDGNGSLILKWKCPNPPGSHSTSYQIYRQVGGVGAFEYLGGVGERKFTDTSIPAGATMLTYRIQATRTTAVGMWANFVVNFGTNASGTMTATVADAGPKLAA